MEHTQPERSIMRLRNLAVLLITLVTVGAACQPEDVATTEPSSRAVDLSEFEPNPDWECFYLPGLVAVTDVAAALDLLPEEINAKRVVAGEILDVDERDEAAAAIDANVSFIGSDADPLQVALALTANDNPSSPIHAMGLAAHWGFAPGTSPSPIQHRLPDVAGAPRGAAYIAVVDSGIDDTALPKWMAGDNVFYEAADVETVPPGSGDASHGTFVAGVIRQLSPDYRISLAAARTIPPASFVTRPSTHNPIPFNVSSEIHVAYAIERIRQRGHQEIAALNLSLGAYVCDPADDALVITLSETLEDWAVDVGGEIFAASGNEDLDVPFWPAMMSVVTGIQASDGTQGVVWSNGTPVVPTWSGPWIDELAPGADIVGLRGGGSQEEPLLVSWSGSSFASAVATGLVTRGDSIVPDHASVPGLSYLDQGQPVTNP